MIQYIYALSMFAGTTIGVGIFGLPYVTAKFGFIPTLGYFLFLTTIVVVIHLLVGEISLRTKGAHRMPGFAKIYLGKRGEAVSVVSSILGLFGANLAYIIVGGGFVAQLFMPILGGTEFVYVLLFFVAGSFIIFLGTNAIAKSELLSIGIFFAILFIIAIYSWPHIQSVNFFTADWQYRLLPYGVILFSLSGASVIPEVREMLGRKAAILKSVLIVGTIIPALTYIFFIFIVLGVTGSTTTVDALSGLRPILGPKIIIWGYILGIITTFTSYLTIGQTLKKIFWYDLRFNHFSAWVFASFIPLLLYLSGFHNFITIIGLTGAITIGIDVILTFLIHQRAKIKGQRSPEYDIKLSKLTVVGLTALFIAGVILSIATAWQ